LELLGKLPYLPSVIFCTSNTQYAYEAFQIDAVDFLKKPIVFRDLQKAISKLVELKKTAEEATHEKKEEIYVKSNGRLIRLDFSEILYFENYGDYVKVHTTGEQIVFQSSLKSIESKLQGTQFLKVHRSYIVNLKKIVDIEENTLVIEQKVIPISRVNRPILMSKLDLL
jgi:DNA-binding LytR/AlgR family response regulator